MAAVFIRLGTDSTSCMIYTLTHKQRFVLKMLESCLLLELTKEIPSRIYSVIFLYYLWNALFYLIYIYAFIAQTTASENDVSQRVLNDTWNTFGTIILTRVQDNFFILLLPFGICLLLLSVLRFEADGFKIGINEEYRFITLLLAAIFIATGLWVVRQPLSSTAFAEITDDVQTLRDRGQELSVDKKYSESIPIYKKLTYLIGGDNRELSILTDELSNISRVISF